MEYLFQVSIGPVQSFIASARRTQDLRFGSQLLSELAKAAAKKIVEENGDGSLIFPAPQDKSELKQESPLNVANKIVARIHEPQRLGDEVRKAIHERLEGIKDSAFRGRIDEQYKDEANKQIDDLVEYFWVALPFVEGKYEETRKQLEALMAARKNTRDFIKVKWGSHQPKSSIDGQLESVIPEFRYSHRADRDSNERKREKAQKLYDLYKAGPSERLSGIDLLKRNGKIGDDSHFPSTSHIATLPFLMRLEQLRSDQMNKAQSQWNEYIKLLKDIANSPNELEQIPKKFLSHSILDRYEGSLLFEERLVDVVDVDVAPPDKVRNVKEALRAFYRSIDNVHPIPYYAIIQADGDYMGAVIDFQAKNDIEEHRKLSQKLDGFSRSVSNIVEKIHGGALVYAGGDDVQALLPLNTVLQCAQELATKFRNDLELFKDKDGNTPTLSVGIAIVHHLDSLQDSLELARNAETKAKKLDKQKNALAITVSKRSGSDYSVVGRWGTIDNRLKSLTEFYESKSIPAGTAYELENLVQRLGVLTDTSMILHKAARAEAFRILERKLALKSEEQRQKITDVVKAKLDESQARVGINLEQLVNEMLVAQLLAEANMLATMK